MPMHSWTGAAWAPTKTLTVWNGTAHVRAKKVKVWNGSWILAWVHPVVNASLSLSKSNPITNETYNVTLTAPGGFPEGAAVTFRFTGYSHTVYPAEGATTATLTGAAHATGGTYTWYADVTTKGGNTSFGPVTQSVSVPSTTVALTAPSWVLSTQSGSGGAASIQPRTFTIDLSNPSLVSRVSFQLSFAGGAWTEYAGWNSPAAQVSHTMNFSTPGSWRARAVVTQTDAVVLYSAEASVYCYIKHLYMSANPTDPVVGSSSTLTAWHGGDALASTSGRWQYMYPSNGVWVDNWSTQNPVNVVASGVNSINWRWAETFSDGSWIQSNTVLMTIRSADVTVNGGHCHDIQAGLNTAAAEGKTLRLTGTFLVYTNVDIPSNVYINATGAKFNCNRDGAAYARPGDAHNAGKFVNQSPGTGGYKHAGWFTWDGGEFDGNGEGCFTISHSPGFTIKNATFYRYCANQTYFSWGDGHAIEINSSGGTDNASGENGTFNVQILNNSFLGTDMGQRAWGNDEPVQLDWSWEGSGGASPHDGTMCHNVLIQGNYFHRYNEGATVSGAGLNGYNDWQWRFAICAIGGHDPSGTSLEGMQAGTVDPGVGWWIGSPSPAGKPKERHNHVKISGNNIHGAAGYAGGSLAFDKGAIHAHRLRQVWVVDNNFYGCGSHQVSGWASDDIPTYGSVARNTSNNGGNPNSFWVANS
jgi:hypothetical protein